MPRSSRSPQRRDQRRSGHAGRRRKGRSRKASPKQRQSGRRLSAGATTRAQRAGQEAKELQKMINNRQRCGRKTCKGNDICDPIERKCISPSNRRYKIILSETQRDYNARYMAEQKRLKDEAERKRREAAEQKRKEKEAADKRERLRKEKEAADRRKEKEAADRRKEKEAADRRKEKEAADRRKEKEAAERRKGREAEQLRKVREREAAERRKEREAEQRRKQREAADRRKEREVEDRRKEKEREAAEKERERKADQQRRKEKEREAEQRRKEKEREADQRRKEKAAEQRRKEKEREAAEKERERKADQQRRREQEREREAEHRRRMEAEERAQRLAAKYAVRDNHIEWAPWVGTKQQGEAGFQRDVQKNLRLPGNDLTPETLKLKCAKGKELPPFAFQRVFDCLVHPVTPVRRALVKWRTGSGKTRSAVQAFNNYYYDVRPKIFFVPNEELVLNFYEELFRYPNAYRSYVVRQMSLKKWARSKHAGSLPIKGNKSYVDVRRGSSPAWTWSCSKCGHGNKNVIACSRCDKLEPKARTFAISLLNMHGRIQRGPDAEAFMRGDLPAPIRAMVYSRGGGGPAKRGEIPVLRFAAKVTKGGAKNRGQNPYDDCIIVCDEIHEIFHVAGDRRPDEARRQLQDWLRGAKRTVFMAMTATPVSALATMESERARLMAMVKGPGGAKRNDEGYIFNFDFLSPALFPRTIPDLATCHCLGNIVPVVLQGENLKALLAAMAAKIKGNPTVRKRNNLVHKMVNACNQGVNAAFVGKGKGKGRGKPWEDVFKANPFSAATKLSQIVSDLMRPERRNEKTLIMIDRSDGYRGMLVALRYLLNQSGVRWAGLLSKKADEVRTSDQRVALGGGAGKKDRDARYLHVRDEFNSFNPEEAAYGEGAGHNKVRVLVVDAQSFSVGVSFFGVERFVLVNPPPNYMLYMQQVGRPLRACRSHISFFKDPRRHRLHVDIYVAKLPSVEVCKKARGRAKWPIPDRTPDEIALKRLDGEKDKVEGFLKKNFVDVAMDAGLYVVPPTATSSEIKEAKRRVVDINKEEEQYDQYDHDQYDDEEDSRNGDDDVDERDWHRHGDLQHAHANGRAPHKHEPVHPPARDRQLHLAPKASAKRGMLGLGGGNGAHEWVPAYDHLHDANVFGGGHKKSKKKKKKSKKKSTKRGRSRSRGRPRSGSKRRSKRSSNKRPKKRSKRWH
jgi:hypothetical protein